ncbi:hypothetical protein Q3C01_43240 [Bradyrhizobium sp. UFLA05-109]
MAYYENPKATAGQACAARIIEGTLDMRLIAVDARTGQPCQEFGPFGMPSFIPLEIGTPNNGGSVVTAGGPIFISAVTDDLIKAIDIKTGEIVWSDVLPAGGQATPIVYEQDGKEYVVIMADGHHFMMTPPGDSLIAYALPDKK